MHWTHPEPLSIAQHTRPTPLLFHSNILAHWNPWLNQGTECLFNVGQCLGLCFTGSLSGFQQHHACIYCIQVATPWNSMGMRTSDHWNLWNHWNHSNSLSNLQVFSNSLQDWCDLMRVWCRVWWMSQLSGPSLTFCHFSPSCWSWKDHRISHGHHRVVDISSFDTSAAYGI